jgi:hypothetical protein
VSEQVGLTAEPVPRFRNAFEKLASQIRAVPESALVPINVDVPTAVATALGVLPEVQRLRPRMAELPGLNHALVEQLEDLTLALGHAHGAYMAAIKPPRSLEELGTEASQVRDTLLADAQPLAGRGLINGARLSEVGKRVGYRNVAFDLLAVVSVLRERWAAIGGRTAIQLGELEQAEILADRLLTSVGVRDQAPVTLGVAAEERQKVFSLFVAAYNELRRAVFFLRFHEDDADRLVPSLYAGRGRKRQSDEPDAPDEQPSEPNPLPPSDTLPGAPKAIAPTGMPGAAPFTT